MKNWSQGALHVFQTKQLETISSKGIAIGSADSELPAPFLQPGRILEIQTTQVHCQIAASVVPPATDIYLGRPVVACDGVARRRMVAAL